MLDADVLLLLFRIHVLLITYLSSVYHLPTFVFSFEFHERLSFAVDVKQA